MSVRNLMIEKQKFSLYSSHLEHADLIELTINQNNLKRLKDMDKFPNSSMLAVIPIITLISSIITAIFGFIF
ncbi:MAG: hypothetical protein HeimC3_34420 [Candidatus Heimdallarchaeota archaeon LC_3]|nr:MAG: hypothetical protein HeimC3_34420 [Candidatus Heimdallarchaeota archaeon LC_3]